MESIKEAVDAVSPENADVKGQAEGAEASTADEAAVGKGQNGGDSVGNGGRDPRGNALWVYSWFIGAASKLTGLRAALCFFSRRYSRKSRNMA